MGVGESEVHEVGGGGEILAAEERGGKRRMAPDEDDAPGDNDQGDGEPGGDLGAGAED